MISHKYKCIFVHIPKCGGSSIKDFFFGGEELDWRVPDYEKLYGWCPERKIHLQHATSRQLIETGLISEEIWQAYFKFTVVRNPWDRSYSDYIWMKKDRRIWGTFSSYLHASGPFKKTLADPSHMGYRGDHLLAQTRFFDLSGPFKLDYVGRFESYADAMAHVCEKLNCAEPFDKHANRSKKRHRQYSLFYTNSRKKLVEQLYREDIEALGYSFEDDRTGLHLIKRLL